MLKILVDMDEVVADLLTFCIKRYNLEHNTDLTMNHLHNWDAGGLYFQSYFEERGIYEKIPVVHDSQYFLKKLHQEGNDIWFVSGAPKNDHAPQEKRNWIDQHFGFIGSHKAIFTTEKHEVQGDILIDDSPVYLEQFLHRKRKTIKLNRPYNQAIPSHYDADTWCDIYIQLHDLRSEKKRSLLG